MRSRIKKWLLCAGVALVATSCIVDEYEINPSTGEPGTVRFTLAVPGHSTPKPSTRALTEPQEKAIDNVYVLAFYASGDYSGKLAYLKEGEPVTGSSTTFEIELPMGSYDLMVVGNAETEVKGAGLIPRSTTKANAIGALTFTKTGKWDYTKPIPVWGYTLSSVTVSDTTPAAALDIDMHRMVARIDVELSKLAASGTETGEGNANFALTEVYLANYNTVGQIAPDLSNLAVGTDDINPGKEQAIAPSLPTGDGNPTGFKSGMNASSPWAPAQVYNSGDGLTASKVERVIYTFEAKNGGKTTHSTNPCLVIGGSYKGDVKTTYYRVDFITKGGTEQTPTYLDLLRNHRYEITINKVTGAGYDTPKEAFDARSFNMEADVMEWEEADMVESGFDGQYTLAISQNVYEFEAFGGSQPLSIRTDYPGGWKATIRNASGSVIWLTVPSQGTVGVNTIDISAPNYAGSTDRTAYVYITAGRITLKIEIIQKKTENKVYASPGVVGIKKSAFDWLTAQRAKVDKGANWIPRTAADWSEYTNIKGHPLTIKGSSTYAGTWVETNIANGGKTTEFTSAGYGGLETEPVYVVYFKWGSMIAMIGGGTSSTGGDPWSIDDVVWVNPGFTGTITASASGGYWGGFKPAPYDTADYNKSPGNNDYGTLDATLGHGDICDEITGGDWRIPTGHPFATTEIYMGANHTTGTTYPFGDYLSPYYMYHSWEKMRGTYKAVTYGRDALGSTTEVILGNDYSLAPHVSIGLSGAQTQAVTDHQDLFLPAAGQRRGVAGEQGINGYFWTSTFYESNNACALGLDKAHVNSSVNYNPEYGFAVRCVRP